MSQLFANNAKSNLASTITADSMSLSVITGEGALFPTLPLGDDHMLLTLENSSGDKEIIKVTQKDTDTFTISARGQDGTTARAFAAGDLVELRLTAGFIDALKEGSIVFVIDGGGTAITAEASVAKGWIEAPFNGTIKSARLFADTDAGSITVNIWKDVFANFPPVETWDDVTPTGAGITLSSAAMVEFTDLSGWQQRNFSKGDIFAFNVSACSGITRLTISLTVDRF